MQFLEKEREKAGHVALEDFFLILKNKHLCVSKSSNRAETFRASVVLSSFRKDFVNRETTLPSDNNSSNPNWNRRLGEDGGLNR